ncbi:outer membrane protein assembly factor BamA [Azospirillum brasilense]|uniref:outer membrane protein assembly factor BamA n=1 Tax=Azospirillum brasilense TaxID=192 RepID=UPI001EDA1834|nr:outer membrane protein assembly factor BamA [Azospirillum brasilense]UKJ72929.1 outer membrane protein assembly factor BamA [Azospirillum brasilense]
MRVSSRVLAFGLMAGCAMTTVSLALSHAAWAQAGAPKPGAAKSAAFGDGTLVAQMFSGGTIRDIRVEGVQRIEPTTVRSYLAVAPGDPFDPDRIDQSLKALFNTGLFADVVLKRDGDALVVQVAENPIINRIAFEGNRRIEKENLEKEIQLRPRVVYTRTRVQSDVQRILDIYRRQGRFAATVEPKIIQLDQNRVDLVFEINEGVRTGVRSITFIGNEKFSDGTLREAIQTRESAWWRFMTSDDNYDPDRLNYDRDLLRRYYLKEGYADFRVVSAVAELTPDREDFVITFTVDEGERYKFGKMDISTSLKALDPEQLRSVLSTREGDWYNAQEVENTITKLSNAVGDLQYAFVDVRPRISRNRDNQTIDIVYDIVEGPRVFVERIDVTGNVRTLDKVVRREMLLSEGDPFSTTKLRRSEQRIKDLGYFERVNITTAEGSAPDRTVMNVEVTEQSTGEISIGAGYSTSDGPLADFSIRERNLLGRGQDLRFGATVSGSRQEYDVSFTEPYFLDRDLSAGFDLFRITRDYQDESSFDEKSTGMALRMGYPLTENLRQRVYYQLQNTDITSVPSSASRYIQDQKGSRLTSLIGQELTYDRRNSRLNPTEGYYIRLTNDLAGLGGDARFLRNRLGAGYYLPLFDESWVVSATGEVGYIVGIGDDGIALSDRFFIGGDTLRGFNTAGIGPRDLRTGDALGGTRYYRGSVEMTFPVGLPEEFGLKGHAFTDVGTLGKVDINDPLVPDDESVRLSVGTGLSWRSPFGPIRLDFAVPILKEDYDKKEIFRFSFGTRF